MKHDRYDVDNSYRFSNVSNKNLWGHCRNKFLYEKYLISLFICQNSFIEKHFAHFAKNNQNFNLNGEILYVLSQQKFIMQNYFRLFRLFL